MLDYDPNTGLDLRPYIQVSRGNEMDDLLNVDALNARQVIRLNEQSTLAFQIRRDNEKSRYFEHPDTLAEFGGRVYCLIGDGALEDEMDDSAKDNQSTLYKVIMKETWYKLEKRFVTAYNVNVETSPDFDHIDTHMVVLLGNSPDQLVINGASVSAPYPVGTAKYFFWCLLYGSGWTLDERYADCWPDGVFDLETDKKHILENIDVLQSLFGGFVLWDSKGKRVALVDEAKYQADDGFMVAYGVQYGMYLKAQTRSESRNIYTRLYVYGNENLNIAAVNGGKEYLDNFSYTSEILEGIVTHNDIYNQDTLLAWGKKQGAKFCKPRFTYKVVLTDKRQEEDPDGAGPEIAKLCTVHDPDQPGGWAALRVIATDFNCFVPADKIVEVGDVSDTFPRVMRDIMRAEKTVNKVVSKTGQVAGGVIRGETPALTASNIRWDGVINGPGGVYSTIADNYNHWNTVIEGENGIRTITTQNGNHIQLVAEQVMDTDWNGNIVRRSALTVAHDHIELISKEVRDYDFNGQWQGESKLTLTAKAITSMVSEWSNAWSSEGGGGTLYNMSTTIEQTATRVSAIVNADGKVIASAVLSAITSGRWSNFTVGADRVEFNPGSGGFSVNGNVSMDSLTINPSTGGSYRLIPKSDGSWGWR